MPLSRSFRLDGDPIHRLASRDAKKLFSQTSTARVWTPWNGSLLTASEGRTPLLKKTRWHLFKREENLKEEQRFRLRDLLRYNLKTVRAYLLKEAFQQLWKYSSHSWAGKFLDEWCRQTIRSRIEPMKKIARSPRQHRELILNYFRAQKLISNGVVEGLNNKAKITMRKSYSFRTYRVLELALYHSLGKLPEPESTHDFF